MEGMMYMAMLWKLCLAMLLALTGIVPSQTSEPPVEGVSPGLCRIEFTVGGEMAPQTILLELSADGKQVDAQIEYGGWELKTNLPVSSLLDAQELLEKWDVRAWDGFDASNYDVLDGEMFWLEAVYSDGSTISAHGDNSFPPNYDAVKGGIFDLVEPTVEAYWKENGTDE